MCSDTVINGNTYIQVVALQVDSALNVVQTAYMGGLRSGGGVVRFLPNYSMPEYVLYDFNLEAGDVIDLIPLYSDTPVSREVDSVKVEMVAGKMRKVIYFAPGYPGAPVEYWMEGIGSSYGLLGRAFDPGGDIGSQLLCFKHDEEYLNLTFIECFLPELPAECGIFNAGQEVAANEPLKLTASPNPSGDDVRFSINQKTMPEPCVLKIYTANGKLLKTVGQVGLATVLPNGASLKPGFYIAVLESEKNRRVLAHCTFVTERP
ncbi:MAG: T9SS type A sorting domain-containing protein [Bacteroidetes bacterium]|nr:T9SS type A sorting domain-containing protein [Bacteroidota bacterium]